MLKKNSVRKAVFLYLPLHLAPSTSEEQRVGGAVELIRMNCFSKANIGHYKIQQVNT